jgi:drug/metabolite transporter (DMT)-like permease
MIIKIAILLLMTIMGAFGGYFFKRISLYKIGLNKNFIMNLLLGGGLYFLSALLNIYLLKLLPYTIAYPLTSLTYLWTLIISYIFLSEKITLRKILGVSCIIIGCCVLLI